MFDKRKDSILISEVDSVFRPSKGSSKVIIGDGVTIKGEINNAEEVQIDGIADISLKTANITVGSKGNLKGTIEAENADIWGKVDGDLKISNTLTIQDLGVVSGKIEYVKLQIKLGGEITGDMQKIENTNSKKVKSVESEEKKEDKEQI